MFGIAIRKTCEMRYPHTEARNRTLKLILGVFNWGLLEALFER